MNRGGGSNSCDAMASAQRRRRRSWRHIAVLFVVSTILVFGILEAVQWSLLPAAHPLRRRPGPAVFTFHTNGRILPGISGETRFTTESHGLRYPREIVVPKPPGVYRIFCVGGSTTECTYLDDAEAWPSLVEAALRSQSAGRDIEVINAGFSGLTSADHVTQIKGQLFPMQPDCIVLMAGMNDHIRRSSLGEADRQSWSKSAMDYSMTVRRLILAWRAIGGGAGGGDGSYAMDATGEIYLRLRAKCAATPIAREAAGFSTLSDPLPFFRSNVMRIADMCQIRGTTLVLVTHPSIFSEQLSKRENSLLWMKAILKTDGHQAPMSWHVTEIKRINDWTRQFALERGLALVDADGAIEKSARIFYDDCHLNVAGSKRLANIVSDKLKSLPRP